ncbi:AraC family transcriptional regulator [Nocardia callitridis]|uniref:Helix-turn-helix transcriptional regulator n=1 Tax=Nocardia callitridis TaxID=648753 RepID=A0ABP9KBK0_9NOCA
MIVGAGTLPAGHWFPEHHHPQHQIVWAAQGVLAVEIEDSHWVLPPTRALWVPGGMPHRTGSLGTADMRGIYLEPDRCPATFPTPTMLHVPRLLHALFDLMTEQDSVAFGAARQGVDPSSGPSFDASFDTTASARRARAEAVVFDLLIPVEVIPIGTHPPTDPRARQLADVLTHDPADPRTLEEFAAACGTSRRTLARLFRTETGIPFGEWRTQIRMAASLPLLASGLPIARVAGRVGYATPSAYVAAFRRTVGVSPGRYFAE